MFLNSSCGTLSSDSSNVVDLSVSFSKTFQPKYQLPRHSCNRPGKSPTSSGSRHRSFSIMAIIDGRGVHKGQIGLASMDIRYPTVEILEFIDSTSFPRLKAKINVMDPVEILLPEATNEKANSVLLAESVKDSFPNVAITMIHKRYFASSRGVELVEQLGNREISNFDGVMKHKQLALAACAALVKYVEYIQHVVFSTATLRFTFSDIEKICLIDVGSLKNLEIIDDYQNRKERTSLLNLIDETLTTGGSRFLRSNLLQPSADWSVIDERLDAVIELVDDVYLLNRLRKILARTYELNNVLAVCFRHVGEPTVQAAESNITQLLRLKQTLEVVQPLRQILEVAKTSLLVNTCKALSDSRLDELMQVLDESLDSSVLMTNKKNSLTIRNQKCYAIKEGLSVNLDLARRAYEELVKEVVQQQGEELAEHLPNEDTRLGYSAARGFHYVWKCPNASVARVPKVFLNVVRNRASITFTSRELIRYSDRIEQTVAEVLLAGDVVAKDVLEQVRERVAVLYYVIDGISMVDFIGSLALYASKTNTVRPKCGTSIVIGNGRHPLLDTSAPDSVVPNDTYLTPESRFAIITGPNMAGKSTYLKQVCQLVILALCGSLVPADHAVIPPIRRVFSRVGHNDSVQENQSAFEVEMSETKVILNHANENSLIVIDELARSTATEEGIGISFAIAETLVNQRAFTILATHFLDLASLDAIYSAVENYHFTPQMTSDEADPVTFHSNHKLFNGPYQGPLYGLELLELTTFPEEVINESRELATRLRAETTRKMGMTADSCLRRALLRTAHRARQVLSSYAVGDKETVIEQLKSIRKYFLKSMEEAREMAEKGDMEGMVDTDCERRDNHDDMECS